MSLKTHLFSSLLCLFFPNETRNSETLWLTHSDSIKMTRNSNCDIVTLGRVSPAMLLFVLICYSQTLSYALLTTRVLNRRITITTSSSSSLSPPVSPLFATTVLGTNNGGSKSANKMNDESYGDDEFDDDEDDDDDDFEYLDRRTGRPLGNNDQGT